MPLITGTCVRSPMLIKRMSVVSPAAPADMGGAPAE
jgi:hypothetical protein